MTGLNRAAVDLGRTQSATLAERDDGGCAVQVRAGAVTLQLNLDPAQAVALGWLLIDGTPL